MRMLLVDTDVVSYLFKKDTRAVPYEPHLQGRLLYISFAWIAATALQFGVPLVTHNRKDYAAVSGLTLISEAP